MTQAEDGARSGGTTAATAGQPPEASAMSPLQQRAFRWLWIGVLISSTGTWMQTVGAQWLVVDAPNAAVLVPLVQAATTLPVMLFALPGGVLADAFDRRWLLFAVQVYFFVVSGLLAVLTYADAMPPVLLLAFTFALGAGLAVQIPTWGAVIPEVVPRSQLRPAIRLDLVSVNVSRAIGPVVAGLVIANFGGVPVVFALNSLSVVFLAIVLLAWHRAKADEQIRERFVPAMRAGGRFSWHEPVVRRLIVRAILFTVPSATLWALLPLIATDYLGLGADGYGVLFGALGVGAILGAFVLGRVKGALSTDAILAAAGVLFSATLAAIILAPNFLTALVILVLSGLAYMAVTSTLVGELQLVLPVWVRARTLAIFTVVFMGSQTVGALLAGAAAEIFGLRATVLGAALVVLLGVVAGLFLSVPQTSHVNPASAVYWNDPRLAFVPESDAGPVLVVVHFCVVPEHQEAFLAAMEDVRKVRRRTGADRWALYQDGEKTDRFVELFRVPTWQEHLRQHEGRLTATDKAIEQVALAYSDPPAWAEHLFTPMPGGPLNEPAESGAAS